MGKFENLVGKRYGRLTVIKRVYKEGSKHTYYLCRCECESETIARADALKSGNTQSCGCLQRESVTTHGKCDTRLYNIYRGMKKRTTKPNDKDYKNYGARGIKVCDEWLNSFESFYDWSISNGYKDGLTIDRIDVNKGYSPNNCRWATQKEQQNNRTNNRDVTYNGEVHTLSQWSEKLGMSYHTLYSRIYRYHWSIDRAFIQ